MTLTDRIWPVPPSPEVPFARSCRNRNETVPNDMSSFLAILGGLGGFLFGLQVMSDGLQKMAGSCPRSILAKLIVNRFAGIVSGFLVTRGVSKVE